MFKTKKSAFNKLKTLVAQSGLFDKIYYLKENHDVRVSDFTPLEHFCKFGLQEDRKPNATFEPVWYREYYEDVKADEVYSLVHFIKFGRKENRFQNEDEKNEYEKLKNDSFDVEFYKNHYEDLKVQNEDFNFILHYVRYGKHEGRKRKSKEKEYVNKTSNPINASDSKSEDKYQKLSTQEIKKLHNYEYIRKNLLAIKSIDKKLSFLRSKTKSEIVVIFHIYYPELIEEVSSYFNNIKEPYDLIVTFPKEKAKEITPLLNNLISNRIEIEVDNIGYDVLPFLELLEPLNKAGYKLFCKVHTKRDHDNKKISKYWRESLLDGILGNEKLVAEILKAFSNEKSLCTAGSSLNYLSYQANKYSTEDKIKLIAQNIGIDFGLISDFGFFTGGAFWGRIATFSPFSKALIEFINKKNVFKSIEARDWVYALECVFGLFSKGDRHIGLVDYKLSLNKTEPFLNILDKAKPSLYPAEVRYKAFKLRNSYFEYLLLLKSKLLDSVWCYTQNIEMTEEWDDCILKFLENKENFFLSKKHQTEVLGLEFGDNNLKIVYKNLAENIGLSSLLLSQNIGVKIEYTDKQKAHNSDTIVSIICATYNHEKFIEQALESMANQKTNFKYEILVGDDCSTDNTASIVKKLYQKYPDIIVPILRKSNIGPKENHFDLFNRAKGKYIALNEGDDYWTNPDKLQMQVEYLEKHRECTVCFHPVEVIDENNFKRKNIYPPNIEGNKLTFEKLINANLIQTNSVMYRNNIFKNYIIHPLLMPGDWFRHLKNAMYGEIHMIPKVMSAYRKHDGGVWSGLTLFHKANSIGQIVFFSELNKETGERFHSVLIQKQIRNFENLYWYYFERNNLNEIYKLIDVNRAIANLFFKKNSISIDAFTIKNEQQLLKRYKEIYKIDVVVTSYNHEKYIAQTLDSVVAQTGLFSLRIIIADDSSTDHTFSILQKMKKQIKKHEVFLFSKGKNLRMLKNMKRAFEECKGNYLAICEGDDYWLSELKLNKQLAFMIQNPEASMCFNLLLLEYSGKNFSELHPGQNKVMDKFVSFDTILKTALTANFSCCFYKTECVKKIPNSYYDLDGAADWLFNLYLANFGEVGFLKDVLSVYRVHEGGQWSGLSPLQQHQNKQKAYRRYLELFPNRKEEILPYIDNESSTHSLEKVNKSFLLESNIKFNIDQLTTKYNTLFIRGWIFDQSVHSLQHEDKYLLLLDKNSEVITLDVIENIFRPDVAKAFSALNIDIQWSGYEATIIHDNIKDGEYSIGLAIFKDGKYKYAIAKSTVRFQNGNMKIY